MSDEIKSKLERIESKIDKLDTRLDKVDVTLGVNTAVLDEHQRRSIALETYVQELESKFHGDMNPVKHHVNLMTYGFRAIAWVCVSLGGIAAFLATLMKLGLI